MIKQLDTYVFHRSVLMVLLLTATLLPGQQLPDNFYDELVGDGWDRPVGITFDGLGRGYVWEKRGAVFILDQEGNKFPEPFIDISDEVGNWGDHGLIGFALHPNFLENGYCYLLYIVDRHHLLYYGTPDYDPEASAYQEATIGRLTRYQADPDNNFRTVLPESRKILIGKEPSDGFPVLINSHGVGSVVFAEDGTMLVSCGDAGSYESDDVGSAPETYYAQALEEGIIRPEDNVGAFRALNIHSLNGKILRLDPETGSGAPSNPFYDPADPDAPRSRVWALGFRNPYRFMWVPETGSHFAEDGDPGVLLVGDVGSAFWEELNVVDRGGQCFGWPLYEGMEPHWGYHTRWTVNLDAPNPLANNGSCHQQHFNYQDLVANPNLYENPVFPNPCNDFQEIPASIPTFVHQPPVVNWSGLLWNPPVRAQVPDYDIETGSLNPIELADPNAPAEGDNFAGFSTVPGFFYEGENFPESYQGKFFVADLSGWIRTVTFDEAYQVLAVDTFATWDDKGVVHIAQNPDDGCLYWCHVYDSQVHKICYGGNPAPVARASADVYYGPGPLTVQFDGGASSDPDGGAITYHWDFGDGNTATGVTAEHTFSAAGAAPISFTVVLTVRDSAGLEGSAELLISLNNTPPVVEITSFEDGDFYPVSGLTYLPLEARVTDAEHGGDELNYVWETFLHHNNHYHPEAPEENITSAAVIDPVGCGQETYWYRVKLTVTDGAGLQGVDEREIFPYCGPLFFVLDLLTGQVLDGGNELTWETTDEDQVVSFEIQRTENFRFATIGSVAAEGGSGRRTPYRFLDAAPLNGDNYYRLKIVHADGHYEYSNVVKLSFPKPKDLVLFPNPVRNELNIRIQRAETEQIGLAIYTSVGQEVFSTIWETEAGMLFEEKILLRQLPAGVYFCEIRDGNRKTVRRIAISR